MIAYHVTPIENLDSISRIGLEPRVGDRSAEIGEASGIFLFPEAEDLETALDQWLEQVFDSEDPLACLIVDITGMEFEKSEAGYEIILRSAVPSGRIKLLSLDIWEEHGVPDAGTAVALPSDTPEP